MCTLVCNVYTSMQCVHQYAMCTPVCNVYTSMQCVTQYLVHLHTLGTYHAQYCNLRPQQLDVVIGTVTCENRM